MDGIQNWRRQAHSFIDYLYNENALYFVEVRTTMKVLKYWRETVYTSWNCV